MNPHPARTVILAAVEPTSASDEVVRTAVAMSRMLPGAELHFLHIINPGPPPHELAISLTDLVDEGRKFVDGVVNAAIPDVTCQVSAHLAVGIAAERIVQVAADLSADLLIVGTHEKKGLSRMLGSVSQRVLANAPCQVLLARAKNLEANGPEIEPPCPACADTQRATRGETLWCARHAERRVHARLHYSVAPGYGAGSMLLRP